MNNEVFVAVFLVLVVIAMASVLAAQLRAKRAPSTRPKATELTVTDATTWEVQIHSIPVATIAEHVIVEIERRISRQWWLWVLTAGSEFGSFARLVGSSLTAGLLIDAVLMGMAIHGDPRGAGHALHTVFAASEATLQSGWSLFLEFGLLCAVVYFALALMAGKRRRAHDFVAEAWWTNVRRAAGVAFDGSVSLVLTYENRQLWRSPRQIEVGRVRPH